MPISPSPSPEPVERLGRRIAAHRAKLGWTQQQLAERLAVSRVAVSHLESSLSVPGERTVALLAGVFGLEPHELVAGTDYPVAKADRLLVVAARWTEVEHQLALLARDLWWLDETASVPSSVADQVLAGWEVVLAKLADSVREPSEAASLAAARRDVGDRRRIR